MNQKIPLVFITDDAYALPTGVAIESLLEHCDFATFYDIYIIDVNLCEQNKKKFSFFNSKNCSISFLPAPDIRTLQKYSNPKEYVTPSCLLKYNIADMLPEYNKVLYLDSDILIKKDLGRLYSIDLKDTYAGVVKDMFAVQLYHYNDKLGLNTYFNAGIMLLNTELFRQNSLCTVLYAAKAAHTDFECMDQTIFNLVLNEHVVWLPLIYNVMLSDLTMRKFDIHHVNDYFGSDYTSYNDLIRNAVVLHLSNSKKAWKHRNAFMSQQWYEYYLRSPFNDVPLHLKTHREDSLLTKIKNVIKTALNLI